MMTPTIPVRGQIKLGQFVKLASLAEDGAQARALIQDGDVSVNGVRETRRGHHLSAGDLVEVDAPWGRIRLTRHQQRRIPPPMSDRYITGKRT